MQYIQQQVKKTVAHKRARLLHMQALRQSVTQLRTGSSVATSLQTRMTASR